MKASEARKILEESKVAEKAKNDINEFWPKFDEVVKIFAKNGKHDLYLHSDFKEDHPYSKLDEKIHELSSLVFAGSLEEYQYKYDKIRSKLHEDGYALDRYNCIFKISW